MNHAFLMGLMEDTSSCAYNSARSGSNDSSWRMFCRHGQTPDFRAERAQGFAICKDDSLRFASGGEVESWSLRVENCIEFRCINPRSFL